jgi:DNA-binding NarL/FixJ family response regulator/tetratricopeptide (TPR) repeat protein
MAQAVEQLVGRAAEIGALDAALIALGERRPGALAIVGEPGIGKTRLLTELGARADAKGWLVLAGSASELEHELPFWVFVDALDDYLAAREPGRIDGVDPDARAELAHVFPALRDADHTAAAPQHERFRTHRAVRQLLEALARRKPLVLLLDDLHWADSGSIELLGLLLRRPPAAPVLTALAVRPRQIPERLSGPLERAHRADALVRLALGALSASESRSLLGPAVSQSVAAALHEESGGNPFYLEQLSRSLRRSMQALPAAAGALAGMDVPSPVAATLAEELGLLSRGARRVLEGASVAGDPFEPELAAAAAAVSETAVMDALDELLRLDLVRPTDVPRRFRFRHPLVRHAVYQGSPGGWRLAAHERSAAELAARGAPAVARAHHVEQAARHGDAAAIAVLREAGMAVVHRTPAGAVRWFRAALRLLPAGEPAEQRIALLKALSGALAATGQFDDARAAVVEAIALVPAGAVAQQVELARACAGIEQLLGRHSDAQARLEAALDRLEDRGSAEAAGLMVSLAIVAFYRVEFDRLRDWAKRALELTEPLGERALTAAATAVLALAAAFAGMRAEADRRCAEAAAVVDAMPDEELALRLEAASHLASAESYVERFAEAAVHAERGLRVARATGQGELTPILVPALATVQLALGRVPEAIELLDGAIESARLTGNLQALALYLFNRGGMAMLAGDLDAALRHTEESVELADAVDSPVATAWSGMILGFVLIERGEPARGLEIMIRRAGGDELPAAGGGWRAWSLDRLAAGWLALGRRAEAARAVAAAEAVAAETGLRHPAAMAQRAPARLALDAGDAVLAAERALASAAIAEELGARLEAALSRILAGRALAAGGDTAAAATEFERAAAALEQCGALGYRGEAERELGRLGRRRPRRSRPGTGEPGIGSLTERELEVARLIVDRRTNTEIAAQLYVSRKTVETHVRNLFHKLDVSSRADVARVIERAARTSRD